MEDTEAVGKRVNAPSFVQLFHKTGSRKKLATIAHRRDGGELAQRGFYCTTLRAVDPLENGSLVKAMS